MAELMAVPAPSVLATVRRFEAAGFRAWPAATVHYDGTWAIRLTAGLPAKRLNSVNPLDPSDVRDLPERIARAARRFDAYGRPLTFRISPLAADALSRHLDGEGWTRFDESLVMRMALTDAAVAGARDQIPLKDIGRFIGASLAVHGSDASLRPGLSEILGAIQPAVGLFALERGEEPLASLICVQDGDLAGLFEVATAPAARNRGHGRNLMRSALKWARLRGARQAWLQVEAGNLPALSLYRSLGFEPVYPYHYRRPPGEGTHG